MMFIRKKIWLTFYFTVFFWTMCLGLASLVTYKTVYNEFSRDQKNLTLLKATSLKSSFNQYESILNIVANELIRKETYKNNKATAEIFASALKPTYKTPYSA